VNTPQVSPLLLIAIFNVIGNELVEDECELIAEALKANSVLTRLCLESESIVTRVWFVELY